MNGWVALVNAAAVNMVTVPAEPAVMSVTGTGLTFHR